MSLPLRQQRIAALRDRIADIERKPALAETPAVMSVQGDEFPQFAGGLLQEIFTPERRNGGAALGFALGQAKSLITEKRRAVIYLQLAKEAQEMGLPYGPGLVSFGLEPQTLILVRPATMIELLWAAEEAIACSAVAAVVADIAEQPKLLDFTASRRLSLRTAASGTSLFMLRYGQWREASAAHLRWQLAPAVSARNRWDNAAPGRSSWQLQIEKGSASTKADWLLGWTDHGFIVDGPRNADRVGNGPPLYRAVPAHLGDRLSQTA